MSNSPPARLVRWLGLDRNPLRRRSDRVECALRLMALLGLIMAVIAGIGIGARAYEQGVRTEQEHKRTRYQTPAVLVQDLRSPGVAPVTGVIPGRARAEWTAPDGTPRKGLVEVEPGRRTGDTVLIWIDQRGEPTRPPQDRGTTMAGAISSGTAVPLGTAAIATLVLVTTRIVNQRRAAHLWEAEWTIVEPSWRHHI
ncbi:hypothetical protein AB0K60_30900 [Thermopolyspora sp. NPDC052614]|uniref:Rv1733c family protein n=1 Tax=Thermopolyspora sp. NPDC052614 TaxID=3155682 RepID=UPI0034314535